MSKIGPSIVIRAREFAYKKHEGQYRDNGVTPYIRHPQDVAQILEIVASNDFELHAAAWLHDTIEDTDTTYEELVAEFGQDVADLVMEVTQEGQKDDHGYYFPRLKTQRGIMLKFADRLSNLSDMGSWNEQRRQHYLKRSKFWKSDALD
ncbi:MAG TPA: HD domain-containing protein [Candidatus Saccharimonadales bacterium]